MRKSVIITLLLLTFSTAFYTSRSFTDPQLVAKYFYFSFASIVLFLALVFFLYNNKKSIVYKFSKLDFAVLTYFLYTTARAITTPSVSFTHTHLNTLLLQGGIYFGLRPYLNYSTLKETTAEKILVSGLLVIPSLMCAYGIIQYFFIFEPLQKELGINGTFFNPGILGNFLVCFLPVSLAVYYHFKHKKSIKTLATISLFLMLFALALTKARTAWIATPISLITVMHIKHNIFYLVKKRLYKLWVRISAVLLIWGLVIFIGFYFLNLKKDSASGRIFIWKITAQMVKDKPVFGHGFATYSAEHNNYQANYFENNYNKKEAFLADFVDYAFNEYLQIASELGLAGLLCFVIILLFALKGVLRKTHNKNNFNYLGASAYGIIVAILIASLFSYPLRNITTSSVLFIALAIISENNSKEVRSLKFTPKYGKVLSILIIGFLLFYSLNIYKKYNAEKKWKYAYDLVQSGKNEKGLQIYRQILPTMKYSQYFLFNYGAELSIIGRYNESINVLLMAESRLNDSNFYNYLAMSYAELGEFTKARNYLLKSYNMAPIRFYPRYLLVQVYLLQNDIKAAKELAKQILLMPIKVPSAAIDEIKAEISLLLKDIKKLEAGNSIKNGNN